MDIFTKSPIRALASIQNSKAPGELKFSGREF